MSPTRAGDREDADFNNHGAPAVLCTCVVGRLKDLTWHKVAGGLHSALAQAR